MKGTKLTMLAIVLGWMLSSIAVNAQPSEVMIQAGAVNVHTTQFDKIAQAKKDKNPEFKQEMVALETEMLVQRLKSGQLALRNMR